jgi:uncharacterized membrane protein
LADSSSHFLAPYFSTKAILGKKAFHAISIDALTLLQYTIVGAAFDLCEDFHSYFSELTLDSGNPHFFLKSTTGVFLHFQAWGNYQNLEGGTSLWSYGLLLAVVATVIPTFIILAGMKRIGPNNAAIISVIGPVSTIIQTHYILGEKIFLGQVIGTILVILGVLLIGWRRQQMPV